MAIIRNEILSQMFDRVAEDESWQADHADGEIRAMLHFAHTQLIIAAQNDWDIEKQFRKIINALRNYRDPDEPPKESEQSNA